MTRGVPAKDAKAPWEWEARKERILDLFLTQDHPLPKVLETLRNEGFDVT